MVTLQWEDEELWNLLNLSNKELYYLYEPYLDHQTIRRTANKYRKKYRQKEVMMPERQDKYNSEQEPLEIQKRIAKSAKQLGKNAVETTLITVPVEHLPYHEKLQEALNSEGRVEKAVFRTGEHEGYIKNSEGEIEYTRPLHAERMIFSVDFNVEPKWPPVTRIESVKLPKRERKESDALRESRKAVILPDLQIPYQDEKVLQIALGIVKDVKPDKLVLLGDFLDLSAWSKYIQRPEFAEQTQQAVVRAHQLLVTLRKICPTAEIVVLEGNHDSRLDKKLLANAQAAFGLRRADEPEGWPVMSVPYLTAMDTLDIEYVSGYPANRYWINNNLQVRHGNLVRSKTNTAIAVAQEERISTIFGHVHRIETQYLTHTTFEGGKTIGAWSIGCLCLIDGSTPSFKSGYDLRGNPVQNYENWQNGLAVVDYEEEDGGFTVQPIYIDSFRHRAVYGGKTYGA